MIVFRKRDAPYRMSDEERARLQHMTDAEKEANAMADPDNPPLTKRQLERAANYRTHKPRYSDSSLYDEVCTVCWARDFAGGLDELSERPCKESR